MTKRGMSKFIGCKKVDGENKYWKLVLLSYFKNKKIENCLKLLIINISYSVKNGNHELNEPKYMQSLFEIFC